MDSEQQPADDAVDLDQVRLLVHALHDDAPGRFYLGSYPEKPLLGEYRQNPYEIRHAHALTVAVRYLNERQKLGVAISVGSFSGRRREPEIVSLAALAVDIDAKDFVGLAPGAATVEQVIPEVLRRLKERGLVPHALIHSGHGLHVYLLIERVFFENDEQRLKAKQTWLRFAYLLRSMDRFDLSSMMRLPGTLNRKYGGLEQAHFITEHTDLNRNRYTLEEIAEALKDVPAQTPEKTKSQKQISRVHEMQSEFVLDPWEQQIISRIELTDKYFKTIRMNAKAGKRKGISDRSRIEFAYACYMMELGFSENMLWSELSSCSKGNEAGPRYVEATILKASDKVLGSQKPSLEGRSPVCEVMKATRNAFYIDRKGAPSSSSSSSSRVVNWTLPNLTAVMTRPGGSKTSELISMLGASRWGLAGEARVGIAGLFVNDLLTYEHTINAAYPGGLWVMGASGPREYDRNQLPTTPEDVYRLLPVAVKELRDEHGRPRWTPGRIQSDVKDPRAFLINATSPWLTDNRLHDGDEEDEVPTASVKEVSDEDEEPRPRARAPFALVKFRAKEELCLLGLSQHELDTDPPCSTDCPFIVCRANSADGGMKRNWGNVSAALFTHKSFETHAVYQPHRNDFPVIIFDELPQSVYRFEKILACPTGTGARSSWRVEPLDSFCAKLTEMFEGGERWPKLSPYVECIKQRRADFVKQAQKARKERSGKMERMAARDVSPLFTADEFRLLVKLLSEPQAEDEDGEYTEEDVAHLDEEHVEDIDKVNLSELIMRLRDFCGDTPMQVYYEHTFTKKTGGSFAMFRPVNAWGEVLLTSDLRDRRAIVLDATAGLDPRYLLVSGAEIERVPDASYPKAVIVSTTSKTMTKMAMEKKKQTPSMLTSAIAAALKPYRHHIKSLLIVTNKKTEQQLLRGVRGAITDGDLPERTEVQHFGNLRGKNEFRDFDAVYFTHLHRYNEAFYVGLTYLLDPVEMFPGKWEAKTDSAWQRSALITRAMISDLYQDSMRIGLRSDPNRRAFIFVPTDEPKFIGRLMRLFPGAQFVGHGDAPATIEEEPSRTPVEPPARQKAEAPPPAPEGWADGIEPRGLQTIRMGKQEVRLMVQVLQAMVWENWGRDSLEAARAALHDLYVERNAADLLREFYEVPEAHVDAQGAARKAATDIVMSSMFGKPGEE